MASREAGGPREIGRYLLCDEIAAGGMATVHIGRAKGAVGFARTVAIKRLHPQFAKDAEFVAMFLDEARIAARIRHPNVVSTIDVVMTDGELFVIMEYVHGEPLSRLIRASHVRTGRGAPVPIALSILSGVLYGLHAAHEATDDFGAPLEIVHRDMSPQNVLLGEDGVPRVVDFGVARARGRLQTTREGALKGKLPYMAPEQVASAPVDRRTDIYAASVVLWELLAGKRLFQSDNEAGVLQAVINGASGPPSRLVPGLPPEIDALVMRGLAKDPGERFASAWEMAEAAQRLAYATPGQVGEWVRGLVADSLDRRAMRVAEMESSLRRQQSSLPEDLADVQPTLVRDPASLRGPEPQRAEALMPSQVSAFNMTPPPSVGRARLSVLAAVGVSIVGGGLAVAVLGGSPAPATEPASAAPASTPTATATVTPAPTPTATATATATATVTATATAIPTVKASAEGARPRAGRPRAAGKSGCNPPYTVDSSGVRIPKMECL